MSKTILADVDGFTPIIDSIVQEHGITTAAVFGKVWRYCQMSDGICRAAQDRMAQELGISRQTFNQHLDKLVQAEYLKDLTPGLLGTPHTYADTGKAGLSISLTGKPRPVKNFDTTCQESLQPPVKNFDTKIVVKRGLRDIKHTDKPDFVNLTVSEVMKLPELRIFRDATGRVPGQGQWEVVWEMIRGMNGGGNAETLRPYWLEWSKRGYSAGGLGWLEWAQARKIPERTKHEYNRKNSHAEFMEKLRRA